MKIGIRLKWRNNMGFKNFIGDDAVACGWWKYLNRMGHDCQVVGPTEPFGTPRDVVIHFHPGMPRSPNMPTLLYIQNSWRREEFEGGTVGVYSQHMHRYDGHIFVSEPLRQALKPFVGMQSSVVLPFAADPEIFYPRAKEERYAHPIAFVGNDIRGDDANERILIPAIERGCVVYGGPFRDPRVQSAHRGRITAEDLPILYSSAKINLNFTAPIAVEYGIVAMRIYEVLMCGGKIMDYDMLGNPEIFRREEHTWTARMENLVPYLESFQ